VLVAAIDIGTTDCSGIARMTLCGGDTERSSLGFPPLDSDRGEAASVGADHVGSTELAYSRHVGNTG